MMVAEQTTGISSANPSSDLGTHQDAMGTQPAAAGTGHTTHVDLLDNSETGQGGKLLHNVEHPAALLIASWPC